MQYPYNGKTPRIGKDVFIAPGAILVGDVEVKDGASIWYGAVLRGDMAPIVVGENSNIQDNATVHTDSSHPTLIGKNVTVGHNAVVHGCIVEDNALVGIGAILLNGCRVGTGCVVGAGSVVREGQQLGESQLYAGVPATPKKELGDGSPRQLQHHAQMYCKMARSHKKSLEG
ncbi:MAG TPA: gamma carbonic anhydrase family protein [Thermotogota bacterium]|nr:gamma carbonic anhydrase family protein [Thermotogota bacterium]